MENGLEHVVTPSSQAGGADGRAPLAVTAAIFLGLAVIFGATRFNVYFREPLLQTGDFAVNALQIENARHFSELYGNYSRFQIHHPGPAFFYVYAAGEVLFHDLLHLTPGPDNAHLLTGMLLQSWFFAVAFGILSFYLPWRMLVPPSLLAAALYFGALGDPFVSIWPPHTLLMPFLCFLAAITSVATGRMKHLPYAVLAGGFLFHGHVAQSLFVPPLGVAAFCLGTRQWRRRNAGGTWRELAARHRAVFAVSAGLILLFLLPLGIDVLTRGTKSNVAAILGRFVANQSETKTALQAVLYFATFATSAHNQAVIFAGSGAQAWRFICGHGWRIAGWGGIFLLPPVAAWFWRGRMAPGQRVFFAAAYAFLAATVGLCVLWGMAQAGPMARFNGYFYYSIYYFAWVLAMGLCSLAGARIFRPAIAAVLCLAAAGIFAADFHESALPGSRAGLSIKRGVEEVLRADPSPRPKLLVFEQSSWSPVAAVALELERRGFGFFTAPWWSFMFGSRHALPESGPAPEDHDQIWWITRSGPGGVPIVPGLSIFTRPGPIRPDGGVIRLNGSGNGYRYVVLGLSAQNLAFAATDLPRAVFIFRPLPARSDVRVVFDAQDAAPRNEPPGGQPAEVYFDGTAVGRVVAGDRSALGVTVPAALWNRQRRGELELRFPSAVPSRHIKRPAYTHWEAWRLWSIRFAEAPMAAAGTREP